MRLSVLVLRIDREISCRLLLNFISNIYNISLMKIGLSKATSTLHLLCDCFSGFFIYERMIFQLVKVKVPTIGAGVQAGERRFYKNSTKHRKILQGLAALLRCLVHAFFMV